MKIDMNQQEKIIMNEGDSFPEKTYTEVVLAPSYDEAKLHLLEPMMAVNKAQLIMLTGQNLISLSDGMKIAEAIRSLDLQSIRASSYTGQVEDLFFQVERELLDQAGEIAGNLHLARSRNDMSIAMFRLTLRTKLQTSLSSLLILKGQLLQFASRHTETLMIGYTHTQQVQPTTMAHYIMAVVDSVTRDMHRFVRAYHNCNQSPMGAAALTTSGFDIDRERMMNCSGLTV